MAEIDLSDSMFLPEWYTPNAKFQFARCSTHRSEGSSKNLYDKIINTNEIRILELMPGALGEKLCTYLYPCSLNFEVKTAKVEAVPTSAGPRYLTVNRRWMEGDVVEYTAISYAWGEGGANRNLTCNGHNVQITETLEAALRHFRHPSDSIMIWVDQICINQEDEDEKGQQVRLMGKVYGLAQNTVIWLGEADPATPHIFSLLNDVAVSLQFVFTVHCPEGLTRFGLPAGDSPLWRDLINFLCRRWFSRLWVIQEVILSWDLWVKCGEHELPWEVFSAACSNLIYCGISEWLYGLAQPATRKINPCEVVENLEKRKKLFGIFHSPSLSNIFDLLDSAWHADCYDPRDKVYGMLAMVKPGQAAEIQVDYTNSYPFTRLYHEIALIEIKRLQETPLKQIHPLLCAAESPSTPCPTGSNLPSWVPNWHPKRHRLSKQLGGLGLLGTKSFFTSIESKPAFSIVDGDNTKLRLMAGNFDEVIDVTEVFHSPTMDYQNLAPGNQDLARCLDVCAQLQQYPGLHTVFDAFWRTVVAGTDGAQLTPAPESYAEVFSLLADAITGKTPSLPGQSYTKRQQRPEGKGKLTLAHLGSRTIGATYSRALVAFQAAMRGRRFGITAKGYMGLFPGAALKGDQIQVISGCPVPYVLRRAKESCWQFVGECYVYGIMGGEALEIVSFTTITLS